MCVLWVKNRKIGFICVWGLGMKDECCFICEVVVESIEWLIIDGVLKVG